MDEIVLYWFTFMAVGLGFALLICVGGAILMVWDRVEARIRKWRTR